MIDQIDTTKPLILIVDDDKFLLDMYSLKFGEKGFEVVAVMTGEEALSFLREKQYSPKVVIFDITMPVIDGIMLLEKIKSEELASGAVLIALSNDSDENAIRKCKEIGVDEYIIKATLTPQELIEKVNSMIK